VSYLRVKSTEEIALLTSKRDPPRGQGRDPLDLAGPLVHAQRETGGGDEVTVDDGHSFLTGLRARALPLLAQTSLTVTASPDSPTARTHDRPRRRRPLPAHQHVAQLINSHKAGEAFQQAVAVSGLRRRFMSGANGAPDC
jgi:hypothetical protein